MPAIFKSYVHHALSWVFFFGLSSCDPPYSPEFKEGEIEGFRPVYATDEDYQISWQNKRYISQVGKIFSYENFLLVYEKELGFHVIDNSDPGNPENLYFVSLPGNTDMVMKDGLIYVNNMADLVVLTVNTSTFEEVQRIEGTFLPEEQAIYPLGYDIYFECVDESKGRVIGWELDRIMNPDCYKK